MDQIIRCQVFHIKPLAGVLARAFLRDPLYQYVFPDTKTRESLIAWDMGNLVHYGIRFGEVFASVALTGCAVWLPPGETDFTEERMAQVGMLDAGTNMAKESEKRLNEFVTATEEVHTRIVPQAHWYLVLLGVDPPRQGQGIGSTLLATTLPKADAGRFPVYLETTKPDNIPFYVSHGFEVHAEAPLPGGGPPVWYMVRQPAPGA